MDVLTVRALPPAEAEAAIETIVRAFEADPMTRWCWADDALYQANMPAFTRAFGGRAFGRDAAHGVGGCAGVALWLPPGVHPDTDAMGELLDRTAPAQVRADLPGIFEQMARYHPLEPHWYLPLIGVHPDHQGRGYGSALLAHVVSLCDRDGLPAYLESSNPRNVPLYRRHGFEAVGRIQSGSSPEMLPMLRRPR